MYVAKRNKTGLAIYNAYYDTTQQEHLSLLGELRRAVERNELLLMYQPKVSLRSSNVSAAEALIRLVYGRLDDKAGLQASGVTLPELKSVFPGF